MTGVGDAPVMRSEPDAAGVEWRRIRRAACTRATGSVARATLSNRWQGLSWQHTTLQASGERRFHLRLRSDIAPPHRDVLTGSEKFPDAPTKPANPQKAICRRRGRNRPEPLAHLRQRLQHRLAQVLLCGCLLDLGKTIGGSKASTSHHHPAMVRKIHKVTACRRL